jgi:hypothetical protein
VPVEPTRHCEVTQDRAAGIGSGVLIVSSSSHELARDPLAARDMAGNLATITAGPFSVDLTDPQVVCAGADRGLLNESLSTTATVDDEVSGPAADLVSAPVDTRTVRVRQVGLTGYDRAGRSGTASYEVRRHHLLIRVITPERQLQKLRAYAAIDFEG